MNKIKICNQCNKVFDDNSIKQFDPCPSCGGEIVFIDEQEYLNALSDEDSGDSFFDDLVEYGSPDSLRQLDVRCSFKTQKDADAFVSEMNSNGYCDFMGVTGQRGHWTAIGSETVKLSEMKDTINAINQIAGFHSTQAWLECVRVSFVK